MFRLSAIVVASLVTAFVTGQEAMPRDLIAMADTERAFARAATVKGWRDAFLEFFADDAVAIGSKATPAKEGLLKQPSTPFSDFELVWEPRLGDVAASGELGWLTGPSIATNHTVKDAKPRYGCYLSLWRKQPDGQWRVLIDVGANAPEAVPFAPGFTRMPFGARYTGGKHGFGADRSGRQPAARFRGAEGGLHQPHYGGDAAPSSWLCPDCRSGCDGQVARRARHGRYGDAYRGRISSVWRFRLQLRQLRSDSAGGSGRRLRPPVESRRRWQLAADRRHLAARAKLTAAGLPVTTS